MEAELKAVFDKVSNLDSKMQSDLAFFWGQELENEINFDNKLSSTISSLKELANNAILDFKNGNTVSKGFDEL
jgi:hypothetical protein